MTRKIDEFLKNGNKEQIELFQEIGRLMRLEETLSGIEKNHPSEESEARLENTKREIKKYLIKAVETGIYDLEIVQKNYKTYVGEELPGNHK